jgi:hypothetical protein
MTWGYGEVLWHKKYKERYRYHEWEIFRDYSDFVRLVIGTLPAMFYKKLILKDEEFFQEKKLTMIAMVGRRFGRIKGSILEKEFYI